MRFLKTSVIEVVLALLLIVAGAFEASASSSEPASPIEGRWDVSFRSPQVSLDTVWVIEPTADGTTSIGTVGDNSAGVSIRKVLVEQGVISLSGNSSAGPLEMTGAVLAGKVEGKFKAGPISGTFLATRRSDVRSSSLIDLFDEATETFAKTLVISAPLDASWQSKRAELRTGLQAPGATERDLVRAVRTLLGLTKLSHNGYYLPVSSRADPGRAPIDSVVTWRQLGNGLGYIRIDRFSADPSDRDRLDQAFADLANTSGLVIDLTGNPGGELGLAMRLGDHLLPAGTNAGLFATRKGVDQAGTSSMAGIPDAAFEPFAGYGAQDFQDALERYGAAKLVTGGRAAAYRGKVALLIDGASASSSEAVAAMLAETGRARLFGRPTAGKMLSSRSIAQKDGYVLRVAFADFRTPMGKNVEGVGVKPDRTVQGDSASVLDAAVEWLAD